MRKISVFPRGFTLIKLLVVIAIIAILAAILFPVFAQAKAAAKDSATLSGTKQLNLGIMMYTADSDDVMPQPTGWTDYYNTPTFLQVVYPYVKNDKIFWDVTGGVNPEPHPMVEGGDGLGGGAWGWWTWNITISPNRTAAYATVGGNRVPRSTSSQEYPTELATISAIRAPGYNDERIGAPAWISYTAICNAGGDDFASIGTYANYWGGMLKQAAIRHNDKIIAGFMDGHSGKKSAKAMVMNNCTYQSTDYYNWYAKPEVAHFAGLSDDPTR